MAEEEKISIALIKPIFNIGQKIYVPQKNKAKETTILGYDASISKENENLVGVIFGYRIEHILSVRRRDSSCITPVIDATDFYDNQKKAQKASQFLEVKLDEESWKIAIGDRGVQDENSPYNLENCDLPSCCGDISDARDILFYCRKEGGLIVHDRDQLKYLLIDRHSFECDTPSQIAKILKQLKIKV